MYEVILKVIDKAIELVKLREKNKRELFDVVIDPLFSEFENVATSYFLLFQIRPPQKSELDAIRNGYLQARIKITELIEEYKKNVKDEEIFKFFESIHDFFYPEHIPAFTGSAGKTYIDLIAGQRNIVSSREFEEKLDAQYEILQSSWKNTVKLYGLLKLKYKLPIG